MSIFSTDQPQAPGSLRHLSPHESKSFLRRGKFYSDSVLLNGQPFSLNAKYLDKIGLSPAYITSFASLTIALTSVFTAGDHTVTLAFIRSERQTIIASFYLSRSRGIWYYLPDYLMSSAMQSSPIDRFGKGYRLESLRLPTVLQIALYRLAAQPRLTLTPSSALFSFAGTAKRYRSQTEFLQALRSGVLAGHPYYSSVQPKPALCLNDNTKSAISTPPASLTLDGPTAPDFSTLQQSAYHISTIFDPNISVDLCDSQDGEYQYNFCHDSQDRAWLSAIEAKSSLTPLALPSKWVALGDFGTPLYLDALHTSDYGDTSDRRHGHYLNMWSKYLSEAPFIQTYLSALNSK